MAVVRSPYANALVKGVGMDEARALPGVIAALESAALVSNLPPLEPLPIPIPGLKKPTRQVLAMDRVRSSHAPACSILTRLVDNSRPGYLLKQYMVRARCWPVSWELIARMFAYLMLTLAVALGRKRDS
jgi:hypothetical protein